MILESRVTFSPFTLAAYSDFMASLDRATQTRKSSFCTTQFYKNIHMSRFSYFITIFLTPHRQHKPLSLSSSAQDRLFQTIRGRNFPSATFKQSSRPVTTGDCNDKGGEDPTVNIALNLSETRIGKGKPEAATAPPIHTHFSHGWRHCAHWVMV